MKKFIIKNISDTKWYFEHEDCPYCGSSDTHVAADGGQCYSCNSWFHAG